MARIKSRSLSVRRIALMSVALCSATTLPARQATQVDGQQGDASGTVQAEPVPLPPTPAGQTAASAVGRAGQRQTREREDVTPTARLDTRISNRVQSRIRNRIDRYYDAQANATSPFEIAGERTRTQSRLVRR